MFVANCRVPLLESTLCIQNGLCYPHSPCYQLYAASLLSGLMHVRRNCAIAGLLETRRISSSEYQRSNNIFLAGSLRIEHVHLDHRIQSSSGGKPYSNSSLLIFSRILSPMMRIIYPLLFGRSGCDSVRMGWNGLSWTIRQNLVFIKRGSRYLEPYWEEGALYQGNQLSI